SEFNISVENTSNVTHTNTTSTTANTYTTATTSTTANTYTTATTSTTANTYTIATTSTTATTSNNNNNNNKTTVTDIKKVNMMSHANIAKKDQTSVYTPLDISDAGQLLQEAKNNFTSANEDGVCTLNTSTQFKQDFEAKLVIFRSFCNSTHKPINISNKEIHDILREQIDNITHIERGNTYGTIIAHMQNIEIAQKTSVVPIKSEKYTLLPSYLGRRT
ncbi:hypothetical protein Ahia01_001419100, partial [Argonauta hians]